MATPAQEQSTSALLSIEASKKATANLVNDLYSQLKQSAVAEFRKWRIRGGAQQLYRQWKRYRMVKTILNMDRATDLAQFYYPIRVVDESSERCPVRYRPRQINDLKHRGNVVILGYVGQGKSILLRYLASREIALQHPVIPILIEMRDIRDRSVTQFIHDELALLNLDMSPALFEHFARKRLFVLFLDGFDEIDEHEQPRVVKEVNDLARRFHEIRMIASSRPGSAIASSNWFTSVRLDELQKDEFHSVLKYVAGEGQGAAISQILRNTASTIAGVLTTPLMIALLVVRFKIEQTVPENELAFFDDLFDLLVRRHDQSKRGYRRARRSKIGDHNLRRVFNGVCFLSRKFGTKHEFTLNRLHHYVARVCSSLSIDGQEDQIAADIIKVTNLIIEEGGFCRFVHRSIQEFHAASFVAMVGGAFAENFYQIAFESGEWPGEIEFLKRIDRIGFETHLLYPKLCHWLSVPTFGIRWYEAVTGMHGDVIDYRDLRYERLRMLLTGYADVEPCTLVRTTPLGLAHTLKGIRDRLGVAIRRYSAMTSDFGFEVR